MKNIFCLAQIKRNVFLYVGVVLFLSMVLATSVNATQYYVGDGSDGALTISSTQTEDSVKSNITAQASSGQKNITVNSVSGFSSGNWVFVIQIKGTGAGNYEFTKIDSITSNTLTMKGNLTNTYQATGAQVIKVKQYSSVIVDYGGVWTASAWDGTVGGILVAMVNGGVTLNNDGSITMAGKGFRGGNGKWTNNYGEGLITYLSFQGESTNGDGTQSTSANGQGGGGASTGNRTTTPSAAGGGGGGYSTSGNNGTGMNGGIGGTGGETAGVATLENKMLFGGGGGGSGNTNYLPVDNGGKGGGIIIVVVGGNITLNTGSFSVKGNKGNNDQSDNTGGAGGGAGGSIRLICANTVALRTGIVVATGGAGTLGSGNISGANGGDGGSGRIATLSGATITGTSNPTIDSSSTDTTTTTDPYVPSDTTAPSGSISINSGASYINSTSVSLSLSATDSVGVTGYYLSESSSTPSSSASGWTSVTSTTSYSASVSYTLSSGEGSKTIYAWYKDAAGNVSSTANATITLDTTVPTVTISSPTSSFTYTATSSTISLGGSASDSSSGISSVAWSNNRGGNGTATGTASWTVSSISLSTGDNVITVTAKDGANNSGTDTLQVTYGTGTTISAPTVSTGSASSVTTSSATLNGIINANGGTTTAWFQYGSTSGSYGNTSSTQTVTGSSNTTVSIGISGLSSGTTYYYRIAASNSAGTSYGGEASFTTTTATATPTPTPSTGGDTTAPTVTITSPTSSATYTTTSNTITLSGTASDNSGSVSSVTWSNSKGGSGTANGTTSWTISSISLSVGDNVITVTATDNAGNPGTDIITVTVPPPTPTSTPTPTPTPTPQTSPTPATTPVPTPTTAQKGVIVGTVADGAAGVGVASAKIILDKGGYSATTGVDGSYTIVDVSAGNYTLTASADGYKSSSQTVTVYAGEATVADFLLKRASEGIIFGFVIEEDSNPLKGVTVTITINNSSGSTETDDDGYYEFRDLEAGGYTLTFEKSGYRTQTLDIILKAGEALEAETITMELEVKGSIFGYVVDISGNPIESVKLKLKGIKTKIKRNTSSDADGFFEFADLDADKYVIFASKKRYKKAKQTVSLDEGDDQEIEIEMGKSSSSRSVIPEAGE